MPSLPVVSGKEAIRAFLKVGWRQARRKGSHICLTKPGSYVTLSIPDHKEIDRGLLKSLIRAAGLTVKEFIELLD